MATGDRIDPYAAFNFTIEIDGGSKPACVIDSLSRYLA